MEVPIGVPLRRNSPVSVRVQLYRHLKQMIVLGKVAPGRRLPLTRKLATQLGVSRNTVIEVFETLCIEGLMEARTGVGTCVSGSTAVRGARADEFLRAAQYPGAVTAIEDPDGNSVYIRH